MIVVSEDRYVPINPEYMVLQDVDGFYYYVHRTFYEQAVVMEDRYGESIETLQKLIGVIVISKLLKYTVSMYQDH